MAELPTVCEPVNTGIKLAVPRPSISSFPVHCAKAVAAANRQRVRAAANLHFIASLPPTRLGGNVVAPSSHQFHRLCLSLSYFLSSNGCSGVVTSTSGYSLDG